MRMKRSSSRYLFLIFLLSLLLAVNVMSADGEITVHYAVEKYTKPISGAAFSIARIMNHEKGAYQVCEQVSEHGITEEDILKHTKNTAVQLSEILKADCTQKTDQKGYTIFSNLSEGVYLIWQSGKDKTALEYENAVPVIVTIPTRNKEGNDYSHMIYPKTSRKLMTPEEEKKSGEGMKVRTGDKTDINNWMMLLLSAVFSIFATLLWKKEREV